MFKDNPHMRSLEGAAGESQRNLADRSKVTVDRTWLEQKIEENAELTTTLEKLIASSGDMMAIVDNLSAVQEAARHLMLTIGQASSTMSGPVFLVNEEDPQIAEILKHAIISLNAVLVDAPAPPLQIMQRIIH